MASLGQIIEKIVEETGLCPVSFRPCAPRVAPRYPLTLIARTDLEDLRMTASPTHQVKTALNEIFTPGVSRDDLKSRGKSLARRVQGAVRHACERQGVPCYGTHGFRKLWAQERYRELRAEGLSEREAKRAVADRLGHGRLAVLKSYIPDW